MERLVRLTKRISSREIEVDAGGWSASYYPADDCFNALVKLAHYEDLEEAGRLVVLPEGMDKDYLFSALAYNLCVPKSNRKIKCDGNSCKECWEATLKGGE